jgi:signal transduction histidine kinase
MTAQLSLPSLQDLPLPAYCCDVSGAVVEHNAAAAEVWGREPNPAHLFQWSGALEMSTAEGRPIARSRFPAAQAVATGCDVQPIDLWVARPDGGRRMVSAQARTLRNRKGDVVGALSMLVDRTESERLVDEIRHRDDARDAFLAMLAHELRNPLAPILTAAALMRKLSCDGRICGMADVVERQARQLSRFVGDLLDASNLAQDGIVLRPDAVPLAVVMACALDELRPRAAARKQRLSVEFADLGTTVLCDPERTSQALANVMINASAFTGEGGDIRVRVRVEGERVEVEVEDTGIGIDPADIGDVFRPYSQFATHAGRLRSGAGLGLAIARDICERHGGGIRASSAGRGQGSCFSITLPIVEPTK